MRYSKEFKLECIKSYKTGVYPPNPGGCSYKTFKNKVMMWNQIFDKLGEAGLEHSKPKISLEDKIILCERVKNGESCLSVAASIGRQADLISKWYKLYLQHGIDGLKLKCKKGRPPKMKDNQTIANEENVLTPEEKIKRLEKELELAKLENLYLKKLAALVQARKDQQQKKK